MYKVKVNGRYLFAFSSDNGALTYDGENVQIDHKLNSSTLSHILYENKSYQIELIEHRAAEKILVLKVNSKEYLVEISDQYDELLHKLGFDKAVSNHIKELKAPMPGMVLNILVKEGDKIAKGDNLVILEAMKMENIMKSPSDGIVKEIKVMIGDKLEKSQVIMGFE
ncbi:acetyl-CoA carboxylase biotin carboxyl carrier protein subunit [Pedobacter sp. P351]|uniref:acetyl-CoA carboxylase biotin carboxyl carrier protein subunit n=1 Tax=Pedobacter superstes TaxID=3133441 RepID=UPI0030B1674F